MQISEVNTFVGGLDAENLLLVESLQNNITLLADVLSDDGSIKSIYQFCAIIKELWGEGGLIVILSAMKHYIEPSHDELEYISESVFESVTNFFSNANIDNAMPLFENFQNSVDLLTPFVGDIVSILTGLLASQEHEQAESILLSVLNYCASDSEYEEDYSILKEVCLLSGVILPSDDDINSFVNEQLTEELLLFCCHESMLLTDSMELPDQMFFRRHLSSIVPIDKKEGEDGFILYIKDNLSNFLIEEKDRESVIESSHGVKVTLFVRLKKELLKRRQEV